MKRFAVLFCLSAALACALATTDARAAESSDGKPHWRLALGVGSRPDYEGSDHKEWLPIGSARLTMPNGMYGEVSGTESSGSAPRIFGNIIPSTHFEFGPVLQYRRSRGDVQSGRVDALPNIDAAVELGAFAAWQIDNYRLETTYAHDVSGEHDGAVWELAAAYQRRLNEAWGMSLSLASTYATDGYMGTYFDVSPSGSLQSGLGTYEATSGFKDVGTRFSLSWGPEDWGGWELIGTVSYYRMIGDAEDSPVVDSAGDPNQVFWGLGVGYRK